ncbi:D-alanyl-D-alanine carboxypeptidase [Sphingomonas psychrotolerans]|uniref:serine-type D-Ala-D-Ala carboxypeptidase n=1 Tax=Sphingomonas psychrotolerans TaxID=1327635 RepID=A0ABU3N026_9SPHN|nr:D-alanyl-D-alanine carboxypeptidase family protein [Sphingomonas psychrotolerans]MDT8757905.1 D-alanyl-D-alanine carboxypeptidase [Sphingomonas psychrotolerans]
MNKLIAASLLALAVAYPTTAQTPPFDTPAPIAYLEDLSSGAVLYAKDADRRIPPASMAKMMTVYVAFDLIKQGKLKLSDTTTVAPETWKKWHSQGSTMFLAVGEQPRVEDLLNGIVTLSGNDACVVLAEKIAGTEEAFVNLMNQQAKKLGLTNSQFGTSNGWPDEGRTYVTARDLAHLAKATIEDHPQLYKQFYSRTSYTWGKTLGAGADITQGNRDPLLGRVQGADGLKTGHTEEAGYGFTGSAEQNGRRLVMVVAGLSTYGQRAEESVRFMQWGFRAWSPHPIASKGKKIGDVEVQGGGAGSVGVVAPRDLNATVPAGTTPQMIGKLVYLGPVKAPIKAGQHVADLIVETPGMPTQTLPLVADADVGEAGFFRRVWLGFTSLFG